MHHLRRRCIEYRLVR